MNQDRFEAFSVALHAGLLAAVKERPDLHVLSRSGSTEENVRAHVNRLLAEIKARPMAVKYDGRGFQRACKTLGIAPTRKAILAYLDGQ